MPEDRADPVNGVLFDLLMAVMNSPAVWTAAAGDDRLGRAWRDAVTARMLGADGYVPYERLVVEAAAEQCVPNAAVGELLSRWATMQPWPDASALHSLRAPYAFVTNCSRELADLAVRRSGLTPRFVLSAEEAGAYKPDPAIYREATRRLGVTRREVLFVAGSPYDADGAIQAGLRGVLLQRRRDQLVPPSVEWIVGSLEEVVRSVHDRYGGC